MKQFWAITVPCETMLIIFLVCLYFIFMCYFILMKVYIYEEGWRQKISASVYCLWQL